MIVFRSIVGLIGVVAVLAMLIVVLVVGGLATLYYGFIEKDWCKEAWAEIPPMIKEIYHDIKNFILNG